MNNQELMKSIEIPRKRNILRDFDTLEVEILTNKNGLQRLHTGMLYYAGNEDAVMVGCEEVMIEHIVQIAGKDLCPIDFNCTKVNYE